MKRNIFLLLVIVSGLILAQCNNSGTGTNKADTAAVQSDSTPSTKKVVEGGTVDSLPIGASDTTHKKDSVK